ncbi:MULTISPECIES: alpha/beta hydrolase family protein [unclassified Cupriavidus]|uniref:alpha/beta hydrolase family protein n=1 Tax=Cupriavidus sp. H19C3 TaxID=3241603 RepID=UPI003BF81341
MTFERIEMISSRGEPLAGRLDLPPQQPARAFALFAHCFTCGKDSLAASRIAQALAQDGIAVLRFDFTGIGGSGGDFASSNYSSNVDDLVGAAQWLRTHHEAPALLIGHSLGGAAMLSAAGRIPEARAVATVAAPSDPGHVIGLFGEHAEAIRAAGELEVSLAGRPFRITRQFMDDVSSQRLLDEVAALAKPLLVLHAPADDTVAIGNGEDIFAAARQPKSFVALDRGDHLLHDRSAAAYAAEMILAWSRRYLE